MKGMKKLFLTAALAFGALGLCMGNAAVPTEANDFNCVISAFSFLISDSNVSFF